MVSAIAPTASESKIKPLIVEEVLYVFLNHQSFQSLEGQIEVNLEKKKENNNIRQSDHQGASHWGNKTSSKTRTTVIG